jgi:hypothetical protein
VAFLYETSQAITHPLGAIWQAIVSQLPSLVAAIIVLVIGVFVAVILGHALRVILEKLRVDDYVKKARLTKVVGHTHVPAVVGELFKWYIIVLFLQQGVALINLGTLSLLLDSFVGWLPRVIIAIVVLLFGLAVANYVELKTVEFSKQRGVRASGAILKWVIVIMVLILSLRQIGVEVGILENTFLMIIGSIAIGIALALGIGLGLGLRKESESFIKNIKKHF